VNALEEYRLRIQAKPARASPRDRPIPLADTGVIVSLDQTLRNTGVVAAHVREGKIQVLHLETIKTTPRQPRGFLDTFDRADQLAVRYGELIARLRQEQIIEHVVLEMPAVTGRRTESSAFAAYVAARAADLQCLEWSLMSAQHARLVVAGPGTANDKKAMHRALALQVPETTLRTWNEHTRDALGNLIAYLIDSQNGDI
jgi:hypothetical protein